MWKAHIPSSEASLSSVGDVVHALEADANDGLGVDEARKRLLVVGPNEFKISKEEPLWRKYISQASTERMQRTDKCHSAISIFRIVQGSHDTFTSRLSCSEHHHEPIRRCAQYFSGAI